MEFHFLDVGPTKFGDCILCRRGDDLILIDGGHPGDQKARGTHRSLPDQIAGIIGGGPPFKLKLLVVTHAHLDHIGCLPTLVKEGTISAEWALVADEKFGWGRHAAHDGALASDALPSTGQRLAAAIREDQVPDLRNPAAVDAFLDASLALEPAYKGMLKTLQDAGTKMVRYGRDSTAALTKAFAPWGMKILGPTKAHLRLCADSISHAMSDAAGLIQEAMTDGTMDVATLYRQLASGPLSDSGGSDRPGAALNNQSIVLSFGKKAGQRVLLAGDMQFIEPDITGIEDMLGKLRTKVKADGRYLMVKTCHHTSHNGIDPSWIDDMGADALLVHSGGENDATHPAITSLSMLRKRAKTKPGKWLRNDRNGLISCVLADDGALTVKFERGDFDNFSKNTDPDLVTASPAAEPPSERPASQKPAPLPPAQPASPVRADGNVEVLVKVPHGRTRVTVTVDIEPEAADAERSGPFSEPPPATEWTLGGGRRFPKLLAVTDARRLAGNVGGEETVLKVFQCLQQANIDVLPELPDERGSSADARLVVREALSRQDYKGVLIIGGPDVVRPVVVDALPPELRARLKGGSLSLRDPDNFVVWSDHPYGDLDGEGINELPVSRVPDGRSAEFLHAALTAPARSVGDTGFGLRNLKRPFAEAICQKLVAPLCKTTAPEGPASIKPADMDAHRVYLMLHGMKADGTAFHGETEDEDIVAAMNLENLPEACRGSVVFTGCCWGALISETSAVETGADERLVPRTSENSIALAFLRRGARAFIGCTGAHYSPDAAPYNFYGGPMHAAFWEAMAQEDEAMSPALALHQARVAYLNGIPHGSSGVYDAAIEYKIFHQFTCLGLGW